MAQSNRYTSHCSCCSSDLMGYGVRRSRISSNSISSLARGVSISNPFIEQVLVHNADMRRPCIRNESRRSGQQAMYLFRKMDTLFIFLQQVIPRLCKRVPGPHHFAPAPDGKKLCASSATDSASAVTKNWDWAPPTWPDSSTP